MFDNVGAVLLAAGKGTRMRSPAPKVLRELLGRSMLWYGFRALEPLFEDRVLAVVGHGAELVRRAFPDRLESFVDQREQLGTGHALMEAWPALVSRGFEYCLVLNADAPLAAAATIESFTADALAEDVDVAFASILLDAPGAYGRVVRGRQGRGVAVVEAKDYDEAVHGPATGEINAGLYLFRLAALEPLLGSLGRDNAGGEYYLTDLVGLACEAGLRVSAFNRGRDPALLGVNSPRELVDAEERLRREIVNGWLDRGVVIRNPETVRLGPEVEIGPGTEILGPCEILGVSRIGRDARVDSHVIIRDSQLADACAIHAFSHLEGAVVGSGCAVGPYARLRPGARLLEDSRVGNFVELKKTVLGQGAKASHLSYLGDAEVGAGVNIGAGTITCNYDGVNKHRTVIGQGAFIGSNSALVAPVTIGENALVGAGSVITKNVPDGKLAVARGRQAVYDRKK